MLKQINHFYDFGRFRLDLTERILLRDGKHIPLQPKTFETLLTLIERHGRIVEKEELMRIVWPDAFVEDVNLAKNISTLRKLLAETEPSTEYIQTIPKRGYRFAAEVREGREPIQDTAATAPAVEPATVTSQAETVVRPNRIRRAVYASALVVITILALQFYLNANQGDSNNSRSMSVAVLPFEELNAPAREEHRVSGLTETLIAQLNGVKGLTVRPAIDGKADLLVEGSVQYSDDQARINVRIIRAKDGSQVWSQVFDKTAEDGFTFQDRISRHVASALRFETGEEKN